MQSILNPEKCITDDIDTTLDYGYITGRLKRFLENSGASPSDQYDGHAVYELMVCR